MVSFILSLWRSTIAFNMVLGMPWLKAVWPCIDWWNSTVAFQRSGLWISLPSQLSDTIPASHEPPFFTVEFAAQFTKMFKQCDKCYCFMLNFTHHVAHGSDKVAEVN